MPAGIMETAEFNARDMNHVMLAKVRATFPGAIWCGGFKSRELLPANAWLICSNRSTSEFGTTR